MANYNIPMIAPEGSSRLNSGRSLPPQLYGVGGALKSGVPAIKPYSPPPIPGPTQSYSAAPSPAPAPAPVPYGGDMFGGGGGGVAPSPSPAPQMSETDFLSGDKSYQAQLAALMAALSNYQADTTAQQSKYDTQYGTAMQNLGYGIPDNLATTDVNEADPNAWNFSDLNSAAGRAQNNQMNDFASRGMLQSSLFGTASQNLLRSLNDQRGSIDTAKTNFTSDLQRQLGDYKTQNNLSQQQAQADALARRTATYF